MAGLIERIKGDVAALSDRPEPPADVEPPEAPFDLTEAHEAPAGEELRRTLAEQMRHISETPPGRPMPSKPAPAPAVAPPPEPVRPIRETLAKLTAIDEPVTPRQPTRRPPADYTRAGYLPFALGFAPAAVLGAPEADITVTAARDIATELKICYAVQEALLGEDETEAVQDCLAAELAIEAKIQQRKAS